jgi:serine/threonine protein kinase
VDEDGRARLCDFGLASFAAMIDVFTSAELPRGTTGWKAPELYDPGDADHKFTSPSQASDVYAFGMVVIEVLSAIH